MADSAKGGKGAGGPKAGGAAAGGGAIGCPASGCKKDSKRFGFCDEHFEHFKFGLIKKTGEAVLDYDKKYEHFVAWQKKAGAKKVA